MRVKPSTIPSKPTATASTGIAPVQSRGTVPSADPPPLTDTLSERHERYGKFTVNAQVCISLKAVMADTPNWNFLTAYEEEALTMIAAKLSRILTGDQHYADNWHDIAGYATLVDKLLNGEDV